MADRTLESRITTYSRFFSYEYPVEGFSLKFASGPGMTKDVKPGEWLESWENYRARLTFSFGPQKTIVFVTKEAAIDVQKELERAVDIITTVAE
jgi:hypothetical protein